MTFNPIKQQGFILFLLWIAIILSPCNAVFFLQSSDSERCVLQQLQESSLEDTQGSKTLAHDFADYTGMTETILQATLLESVVSKTAGGTLNLFGQIAGTVTNEPQTMPADIPAEQISRYFSLQRTLVLIPPLVSHNSIKPRVKKQNVITTFPSNLQGLAIVTSFDTVTGKSIPFRSYDANRNPPLNTSDLTKLPILTLFIQNEQSPSCFIDGATTVINPMIFAYIEARKQFGPHADVRVIPESGGNPITILTYQEARHMGVFDLIRNLQHHCFHVHKHKREYDSFNHKDASPTYWRFNPSLPQEIDEDDSDDEEVETFGLQPLPEALAYAHQQMNMPHNGFQVHLERQVVVAT